MARAARRPTNSNRRERSVCRRSAAAVARRLVAISSRPALLGSPGPRCPLASFALAASECPAPAILCTVAAGRTSSASVTRTGAGRSPATSEHRHHPGPHRAQAGGETRPKVKITPESTVLPAPRPKGIPIVADRENLLSLKSWRPIGTTRAEEEHQRTPDEKLVGCAFCRVCNFTVVQSVYICYHLVSIVGVFLRITQELEERIAR